MFSAPEKAWILGLECWNNEGATSGETRPLEVRLDTVHVTFERQGMAVCGRIVHETYDCNTGKLFTSVEPLRPPGN